MTFLDIHAIQSVPPANLNRDESGSPKTATYGGVLRARVSSQAWKRAVRGAFLADPDLAADAGMRTKQLPQVIADALTDRRPALAPHADTIGMAATTALFKKVKAGKGGRGGRPVTEYLLFLGHDQINRVVDTLIAAGLEQAHGDEQQIRDLIGTLALHEIGVTGHAGAVALFGRMVADSKDLSVDAACQVAHALSTHKIAAGEFDYFTAVDDQARDDESGAGMIGDIEFNSATLYRYATICLPDLVANLDGETGRALDLALAFARTFLTTMPTGKQNSFAAHTRPDFALLSVRSDQPVSLVGAFEDPVRAPEGGLTPASVARLATYLTDQDDTYGTPPVTSAAIYPAWLGDHLRDIKQVELPARSSLDDALATVRTALAEQVTQ